MEIDILPTDTFAVDKEGVAVIRQFRDGRYRSLGLDDWHPYTQAQKGKA